MPTVDELLGPPSIDDVLGTPPADAGTQSGFRANLAENQTAREGMGREFNYGLMSGFIDPAALTVVKGLEALAPEGAIKRWLSGQVQQVQAINQGRTEAYKAAGGNPDEQNATKMLGAMVPAAAVGAAAGPGIVANAVIGGLTSGLAAPAENDGAYWANKAKEVLTGAAFGAAGAAVTRWIAGTLTKNSPEAVKILEDAGIDNLTGGMKTGGARNTMEQAAESYPIAGGMISNRRQDVVQAVNREALNMPLKVIGEPLLTKIDKIGNEGYKRVVNAVDQYYDNLVTRLTSPWDADLTAAISAAKNRLSAAPDDIKAQFDKIVNRELIQRFDYGAKVFHGPALKEAQGELRQAVQKWKGTGWNAELSRALRDVEVDVRNMIGRNNPQASADLNKANLAWAMTKRIEPAVIAAHANGGVFTPGQLGGAVTRGAARYSKEAAAKGEGLIQKYSQAAEQVVGNKLGRSGTAERAAAIGTVAGLGGLGAQAFGAPGGEYGGPAGAAALGGGLLLGALYSRPGMRAAAAAARRPGAVTAPLANAFTQAMQ